MKWTKNHDRSGASFLLRGKPRIGLAWLLLFGAVMMGAQQGGLAGIAAQPLAAGQGQSQNLDAEDAQRKKQIADESASLLSLANSLKAEVDKSTKDTLSVTVVRKAGEIEQLAHKMRTK